VGVGGVAVDPERSGRVPAAVKLSVDAREFIHDDQDVDIGPVLRFASGPRSVHDDAHEGALEEPKGAHYGGVKLGLFGRDPGRLGQLARTVLVEGEASHRRLAAQFGVQLRADAQHEAAGSSRRLPAPAEFLGGTIHH
jgi:hypothetical protein